MSMIIFTLNYIHEYILTYMYTHISYICIYMYIFIYTLSIYTYMYESAITLLQYNYIFAGFYNIILGFPGGSLVKNLSGNAGHVGLIPGSGRSPGEGNGNPLQYSCLGNLRDRRAWQASVHGFGRDLVTRQQ